VGPTVSVVFNSGDQVMLQASKKGMRFLLISGQPLEELLARYGPIVTKT
jgi:redox-sensitive bicupin YhaK (pirin superfamily)